MFLSKFVKNNIKPITSNPLIMHTFKEPINDYGTRMAIYHMLGSLNNEEKAHDKQIYENQNKSKSHKILEKWTHEDIDYFDLMARKHAMKN